MQVDPIQGTVGNPQSLNRYAYVQNDPINFVDPLGLLCYGYNVSFLVFDGNGNVVRELNFGFIPTYCDGGGQGNSQFPFLTGSNLKGAKDALKIAKKALERKECDEALKAAGNNGAIPSLSALVNQLSINGNVFDGRSSTLSLPPTKDDPNRTIASHFKANRSSIGAEVFGSGVTGRSGKTTFLNNYFFNPEGSHFYDQQRALILIHEAVHQFGNKGDEVYGGSGKLTQKIAEKCFPALNAAKLLGNLSL